ncbi:phage tail protein [Streptomyces sp. NBC_00670]|jgi:phage tail-like protein|uniref:phage tail protein n=1 Tax=Streptomyces sp. NBC_00670 TaxID=2975804 RepID=UPI002E344529|nr:phage tail protein [Streptomyces sp. NBC_00670]
MALPKAEDVLVAPNFGIQIDGVMIEYLNSVNGLQVEQDVIKYQQNQGTTGRSNVTLMPGVGKDGQVDIERGASQSDAFTQWIKDSLDGNMGVARKNATIILMDYEDNPVKRWNLRNAWCSKIVMSTLKAGDTSPVTETVTIVFEDLVIE